MKRRLLLIPAITAIAIVFSSNSSGPATGGEGDRTNSPVSSGNCNSCHSGGAVTPTVTITLLDGITPVTSYTPGKAYKLNVTLVALGYLRYGFQATALNASNASAGTFTAGTGTQLATVNGRSYVEHSTPSLLSTFTVDWKAPAAGAGNVTFYASGLGANNNSSDKGDKCGSSSLQVTEAGATSLSQTADRKAGIYPNPAGNVINISGISGEAIVEIYHADGKLIRTASTASGALHIADLCAGTYLARIHNQGNTSVVRFSKAD